ncbi:FtsX-like permease family protein [Roseivirga sp.]|jgi:putative ABC transport system permease protein|uniref:FtsX-like permease family protein n=1 Tax=Roseivirga sp. TaxID=1964215 RepID=UPI002357F478|nr:FtsX-like permease family protein [Roseivirga sp.]
MHQPPKVPLKLFRWFCSSERVEEIEGDLFEAYQDWRETKSKLNSNWLYWWTVIRSFRFYLMKKHTSNPSMFLLMLRHFIKTAFRGSLKHKSHTFINLSGLSIGIATSLMLAMFIVDEVRMDYDLKDKELIYRVESYNALRSQEGFNGRVHTGLGPTLVEMIPEITHQTRMGKLNWTVKIEEDEKRSFFQEEFILTDSTFFEFFPLEFIHGSEKQVLTKVGDAVLTESLALKLYGTTDVVGKELNTTTRYNQQYFVKGVVKDPKPHSSIQFNILIFKDTHLDNIRFPLSVRSSTYIKVLRSVSPKLLEAKINKTIKPIVSGKTMKATTFKLSSFHDAKYDKHTDDTIIEARDKQMYAVFAMVAVFILVLAIINYTNLTAARALQRGQEAGIRKIIGAGRKSFFFQFVTESALMCFLSLAIALLLTALVLPSFEQAINRPLLFNYWVDPWFWGIVISAIILLSTIAGIYPAILVSRFRFSEFIKGNIANSTKGALLRKSLVIFQFAVAIIMIVSATVVKDQIDFIINKKLTYKPEQIILVENTVSKNLGLFRDQLSRIPDVNLASVTTSPPGGSSHRVSSDRNVFGQAIYQHNIDHNYAELLNFEFISGENFNPEKPSINEEEVIINETLAKLIQSVNPKNVNEPLAETYQFTVEPVKIKGIIKDIHMESLYESVKPMIFAYEPSNGFNVSRVLIEIRTDQIQETISAIEDLWTEVIPDQGFNFQFLDSRFEKLYTSEIRLGKIMSIFTFIAILISCMGLYGLIMFSIQSKTKEVGIRKVMGASVSQIVMLFNRQVFWLIGLAVLVAIPIAYWTMNNWLNGFAYHVDISALTIILTICSSFLLAFLTVFFRSYKAANANPVNVLRSE